MKFDALHIAIYAAVGLAIYYLFFNENSNIKKVISQANHQFGTTTPTPVGTVTPTGELNVYIDSEGTRWQKVEIHCITAPCPSAAWVKL
jgi:hypothetical protein